MFFFCCLGGGPGPAQTAKKNTPPPLPNVCFLCCLGGWRVCFFFCCLGGGACRFFFSVWRGACSLFFLFGRGACSFFAVWAGGVFLVCYLGGGREFTLTGLPGSSLSDPTTKKTKQQKKNTGSLGRHTLSCRCHGITNAMRIHISCILLSKEHPGCELRGDTHAGRPC